MAEEERNVAVLRGIYGKTEPEYVGCVLDTYEHNGYDDSDWYAICWDEEKQELVHIEYDTTRAGGGGYARIDAAEDVIRKVYRHYKEIARKEFDSTWNPEQAKKVRKEDTVRVIRGRKVKKGTTGKVFWLGKSFNYYSGRTEDRCGIEVDGERIFLPLEYVEVIGWESRLITGKKRKQRIRSAAVNFMPVSYRNKFDKR